MKRVLLILLFFSFCSQPEILNEKLSGSPKPTYALVVGITNYLNLEPLVNPRNDADAMADVLQEFGFTVIKLIDPSKIDFENSIKEFQSKIMSKKGAILFYYSGHGVQRNGTNFLLPIDADLDDEYDNHWVDINSILGVIEKSKNPVNILILDTCRDNPQYSSSSNKKRGLVPISKVKSIPAPKSTIISYATSPGMTADDGETKNGVYTEALLNNLNDSDYLSKNHIYNILTKTIEQVQRKTQDKQLPQILSNLTRDYYLSKRSGGRIIPYVYNPRTTCQNMGRTWNFLERKCLEPPRPPNQNPDPLISEQAISEQARSEQARSEQARSEQARSEQARSEQARSEQARSEQANLEFPKPEQRSPGPFFINGLNWSVHKGRMNWNKAIEVCKKEKMRLPSKSELKELFDSGDYRQFYPDSWHWSSDELSSDGSMIKKIGQIPQKAYDVFLQKGEDGKSLKAEIRNVRCVK